MHPWSNQRSWIWVGWMLTCCWWDVGQRREGCRFGRRPGWLPSRRSVDGLGTRPDLPRRHRRWPTRCGTGSGLRNGRGPGMVEVRRRATEGWGGGDEARKGGGGTTETPFFFFNYYYYYSLSFQFFSFLLFYFTKTLKASPILTVLLFATWLSLCLAFYHQTRTSSFVGNHVIFRSIFSLFES